MKDKLISVIDYGVGNLGSLLNMFKKIGATAGIARSPAEIEAAQALVLPGVGAFDHAMKNLSESGLLQKLEDQVRGEGKPLLGVCLGMQLLTEGSEEGTLPGLGWIPNTRTTGFDHAAMQGSQRIPHMGWNYVRRNQDDPLFDELGEARFYFLHSYHVRCDDPADVLAYTTYGYEFVSALHAGHIWGVQFHPEKSHKFGMRLLSNFVATV